MESDKDTGLIKQNAHIEVPNDSNQSLENKILSIHCSRGWSTYVLQVGIVYEIS